MSVGQPSADAFYFVLDHKNEDGTVNLYDAYIDIVKYSDDFSTIDCRYQLQGAAKWTYLYGHDVYPLELTDDQKVDDVLAEGIKVINERISKKFDFSESPKGGIDRLAWLIEHNLKESDNVVSRK